MEIESFLIFWHCYSGRSYGGPGNGFEYIDPKNIRLKQNQYYLVDDRYNCPVKFDNDRNELWQYVSHTGYYKFEKDIRCEIEIYNSKTRKRRKL